MIDVRISSVGASVVLLTPLTDAARSWIDENVATEGWQWLGSRSLGVEARFVGPLIDGMTNDGLTVE